jgi:hypothetical protein
MFIQTDKNLGKFFGDVLSRFEDGEYDVHGQRVILTRKTMARLLCCDIDTVTNYMEQRTTASLSSFSLFFANFPPAVVDFAINHLHSLRPEVVAKPCAVSLRSVTADLVEDVAQLNKLVSEVTENNHIEAHESPTLLKQVSEVHSGLDDIRTHAS